MYLLTRDPQRARAALSATAAALPVPTGPVHEIPIGDHTLSWMRAQVRDNLHVHPDAVLIGRRSASEPLSDDPIRHDEPFRPRADTTLPGVVIRVAPRPTVEPLGVTLAYWHADTVSDRQLLLAAHHRLRPGPVGVAMLAGLGFFPGLSTLFDEVRRIPMLERWDVERSTGERTRTLSLPRPDDHAMIERLVSLVPTDVPHALGMSGGYDSRFSLGILRRAGADLRIVRFTDQETELVETIASRLGLEIQAAGSFADDDGQRDPFEFMLLSDAQIWHSVAQYGRLRRWLTPHDMFHSGQFSDSLTKNTFKTAWKSPDLRTPFWDRLIRSGFLQNAPAVQPCLRDVARREELAEAVDATVAHNRTYVELRTKKQWSNWIYYTNRAMRWSQAYYDDLSFSTDLTYLLSDLDAQLLGIATSFWPNLHNDRVAALNHALLPELDVPYAGGAAVTPTGGARGAWTKLEYEYLQRFRVQRSGRARLRAMDTTYEDDLPASTPNGYDALFDRPMHEVARSGGFGLRRANVTVALVLQFLESMPASD